MCENRQDACSTLVGARKIARYLESPLGLLWLVDGERLFSAIEMKTLLLISLLPFCFLSAQGQSGRPNIVLFLVDDLGLMDTSVPMLTDGKGNPVRHPLNDWYRTPHIERLAENGIRFSNFYAHTVCSPTRISIMTGQNAARHRTTQFISPNGKNTGEQGPEAWNWTGLRSESVTLPGLLREAGYRTIHVGKAHFAPPEHEGEDPSTLGFDVNVAGCSYGQPGSYYAEDGYGNLNPKRQHRAVPDLEEYHRTDTFLTEALTIEAKARIDESLEMQKPFYLYLSHYAVHGPFQSDPRFADDYEDPSKGKNGEAFATLVAGVDKSLGDLVAHLEAKGIAENTLILFMGDNGSASPFGKGDEIRSSAPLRGKKGTLWEGGTRVPFIAAWARPNARNSVQKSVTIKPGGVQEQMGICYDVFPTFLAIAGASVPLEHVVDGQDLRKLFTGVRDRSRDEAFLSHFPHKHTSSYFTTYRDGKWKLIYRYYPDTNEGEAHHRLYNLDTDPSESVDLAQRHPERVQRMMRAMVGTLDQMEALYPMDEGDELKPKL